MFWQWVQCDQSYREFEQLVRFENSFGCHNKHQTIETFRLSFEVSANMYCWIEDRELMDISHIVWNFYCYWPELEAICAWSNKQTEVMAISLLCLLLIAHHQCLDWIELIKRMKEQLFDDFLPILLSTSTSLSIKVISLSEADVVDVWSRRKFHFSFCSRFRCMGIFLR